MTKTEKQKRINFLLRRQRGIGGSDIAAIAGLSRYRSPLDVFYDKTGKPEDIIASVENGLLPCGETAPRYWGTVLEDAVGKAYAAMTGQNIRRYNKLLVHPSKPYFIGDVDFLVCPDKNKLPANYHTGEITTDRGLECKTSRNVSEEWGEEWTNQIPLYYICQVQWYMSLDPALQSFDVAALFGGSDLRFYHVERSESLISKLQNIAENFWVENVLAKNPPPPRSMDDVKRLYPQSSNKSLVASSELEEEIRRLAMIQSEVKRYSAQESELKNSIAVAMGNCDSVILPDETEILTFRSASNGIRKMIIKNKNLTNQQ